MRAYGQTERDRQTDRQTDKIANTKTETQFYTLIIRIDEVCLKQQAVACCVCHVTLLAGCRVSSDVHLVCVFLTINNHSF